MARNKKIEPRELRWVIEILNRQYENDSLVQKLKNDYKRQTGQDVEALMIN